MRHMQTLVGHVFERHRRPTKLRVIFRFLRSLNSWSVDSQLRRGSSIVTMSSIEIPAKSAKLLSNIRRSTYTHIFQWIESHTLTKATSTRSVSTIFTVHYFQTLSFTLNFRTSFSKIELLKTIVIDPYQCTHTFINCIKSKCLFIFCSKTLFIRTYIYT